MEKHETVSYIENISLLLLGILFVAFPLVFTSLSTDPFLLPKQILLGGISFVILILWGFKMVVEKKVRLKRTPFDLPLILLAVSAIASSVLAVNQYDSLVALAPFVVAILAYFLIVNTVKSAESVLFVISALLVGAGVLAVLAVLSYFKIYVLPFEYAKVQNFSLLGSYLDQAIFFAMVLPIAWYFTAPLLRVKNARELHPSIALFSLVTLALLAGLGVTVYGLFTGFNPRILPFETAFQTAFASISQDSGRILQGFLVGSGFGTYGVDFARFKQPIFNLNADLWNLQFIRSSSFALELLSTTGILGFGSFLYTLLVFVKNSSGSKKTSPLYVSIFVGLVMAFILPLSFVTTTLLFLLIAVFAATQQYPEITLHMSALSEVFENGTSSTTARSTIVVPLIFLLVFAGVVAGVGYYSYQYVTSDLVFQKSLVAASKNDGSGAYKLQNQAIATFPYRDVYHRAFSQLNLALANSLIAQQPKDSSPSAQVQQTLGTLIQQSVTSGRNATVVAPQSFSNWTNLSATYRSLIGFGKDAESYAVLAQQQAIALNPNDPNAFIDLGGLYFQLKQYDNAIRQFQVAVNLKPDLANAYYNLGHALEANGNLQEALAQYKSVAVLVAKDKAGLEKINKEIEALTAKIGTTSGTPAGTQQAVKPVAQQQDLQVNQPSTPLPTRVPKIELPGPTATPSAK